jgi:hypothetical protein
MTRSRSADDTKKPSAQPTRMYDEPSSKQSTNGTTNGQVEIA